MSGNFQNLFSQGACIVSVVTTDTAQSSWSGTLTFNQQSPTFQGAGGVPWMVEVDGSGNVILNVDSGSASSGFGATINVLPQFDVSNRPTQVSSINSKYAGSYTGGIAIDDTHYVNGADDVTLTFDAVTGNSTPASASFAAHTPVGTLGPLVGVVVNGAA